MKANEPVNDASMPVKEAAGFLGVSVATIRNWVKEGLLISPERGKIDKKSLKKIKSARIGKDKLISRANKTCVSTTKTRPEPTPSDSNAADTYEQSLSDSFKNLEGIFYTPQHIVADMLR
ncbi:MAG: MerR family DNA-binding transcriptional regulator, partial [Bacteroidales bacterium]|nr:MerR family DNA-binding transcriptional regulator [Bacteroidales bacterium]